MFQIPDWEDSVPAANLGFLKEINKKKHKQKNKEVSVSDIKQSNNDDVGKLVRNPSKPLLQKLMQKSKKKNTIHNGVSIKSVPISKNSVPPVQNTQNNTNGTPKQKSLKTIKAKPVNGLKSPISNGVANGTTKQTNKRKHETETIVKSPNLNESFEMQNFDTDKLDEAILTAKKRKLNKSKNQEEKDVEETFLEERKMTKEEQKKQILKNMLQKQSNRNVYQVNGNGLRERMLQRLKAAQFRYLNEKLYTSSGSDAKKLFDEDPNAFQTYHEGYQQQVKKWPVKPLDVIVKRILKMPKSHLIADMGCGEGTLSRRVSQTVRSFDLVSFNSNVEVCDIAHTPLLAASMNVAVYCLALMGTDLTQYIVEANRVLKKGGHLLIAEVESRFDGVDKFVKDVERIGFSLKKMDKSNNVFYFMEFVKVNEPPKKSKLPYLSLKPCFYKKR